MIENDNDGIKQMLLKFAYVNRVVILQDDETQMQKTVNQAMALVN